MKFAVCSISSGLSPAGSKQFAGTSQRLHVLFLQVESTHLANLLERKRSTERRFKKQSWLFKSKRSLFLHDFITLLTMTAARKTIYPRFLRWSPSCKRPFISPNRVRSKQQHFELTWGKHPIEHHANGHYFVVHNEPYTPQIQSMAHQTAACHKQGLKSLVWLSLN